MHDDWRAAGGQPVDHFVLSDGLASVSVYVETNPREGLEGSTRIGAVHAVGRRVSGYQVTVVGEVPAVTVETYRHPARPGGAAVIEETGVVVSVRGELAEVEGQPRSACGGCAVNGACGTSLLARYLGPRRLSLQARNAVGARPGERVVIGLPEGALLEASVLAYLVPLSALVGGAVAGAFVAGFIAPAYTEVLSVVTGLGGLAAALTWLVGFIRAKSSDGRYQPRILRRLALGAYPGEPPEVSPGSLLQASSRDFPASTGHDW